MFLVNNKDAIMTPLACIADFYLDNDGFSSRKYFATARVLIIL